MSESKIYSKPFPYFQALTSPEDLVLHSSSWVSRENGILGLKNENPCFENFSEVSGSWFHLERGEESQVFLEVKL